MIFVTVGTEKFPFDRLIRTVDEAKQEGIIQDDVLMQIGNTAYTPTTCYFERFLPFPKMLAAIEKARVIISHAGIGSTLICLHSGKIPIIFPRDLKYNEHLDNHQQDFARYIRDLCVALVSFEPEDLMDKLLRYDEYVNRLPREMPQGERRRLVEYLRGRGRPGASTVQPKVRPGIALGQKTTGGPHV